MELAPTPPPPPEKEPLDFRKVARRWHTPPEVAEQILTQGGASFCDIPQPPRRGITLAALLIFEENWRQSEAEAAVKHQELERRQAEAREKLALKQAEADRLVEEALVK
jgi:hypothetical protein